MATCKHCKHWYTNDPSQIKMPGRGICLKASSVQRDNDQRTLAHEGNRAHAVTLVASSFGYQLAINQLETTATFKCNEIEEKTE